MSNQLAVVRVAVGYPLSVAGGSDTADHWNVGGWVLGFEELPHATEALATETVVTRAGGRFDLVGGREGTDMGSSMWSPVVADVLARQILQTVGRMRGRLSTDDRRLLAAARDALAAALMLDGGR